MEIEQSTRVITEKLWNMLRIAFHKVRKYITKSKVALDIHLMLKRGKLASKAAFNYLIFHNTKDFTTPREYEFSCSNSPAFYPLHANIKRKLQLNSHYLAKSYKYNDVTTFSAVQRVLEMLNNGDKIEPNSPMVMLPGFGRSPMVKQLRVSDSPYPLKDDHDGDSLHVDKAAEDFIKRFYKDLKLQKNLAIESPYNDTWGR